MGKLQIEVVAVTAGGDVQVQIGVNGCSEVVGGVPSKLWAFTSTGMTAPVFRAKAR